VPQEVRSIIHGESAELGGGGLKSYTKDNLKRRCGKGDFDQSRKMEKDHDCIKKKNTLPCWGNEVNPET